MTEYVIKFTHALKDNPHIFAPMPDDGDAKAVLFSLAKRKWASHAEAVDKAIEYAERIKELGREEFDEMIAFNEEHYYPYKARCMNRCIKFAKDSLENLDLIPYISVYVPRMKRKESAE